MKIKRETMANIKAIVQIIFVVGGILSMIGLLILMGANADYLKNTQFIYTFPSGMTPIEFISQEDRFDQRWLCETESGEYIECSPIVTEGE